MCKICPHKASFAQNITGSAQELHQEGRLEFASEPTD